MSCTAIFLLVISELRAYLTPTTVDHLYVDTTRGERIKINLNVTFPNMPCAGMSLVAMDVAGEQQIDVVSNIIKTRRTLDGAKIGVEMDDAHIRRKFKGKCGPCFPHVKDVPETEERAVLQQLRGRQVGLPAEGALAPQVGGAPDLRARGDAT